MRSRVASSGPSTTADPSALYATLDAAFKDFNAAPPSEKLGYSGAVLEAMSLLKKEGVTSKWGAACTDAVQRRNTFQVGRAGLGV